MPLGEKVYTRHQEQVDKLKRRGMLIDDEERAKAILAHENYYNVINGYKDRFLLRNATEELDEEYISGTTFDEVYALYVFDRNIRNVYLKYCLQVENAFKSTVAHVFSAKYGHKDYLKLDNFETDGNPEQKEARVANITRLIGEIHQETARQLSKHHQAVTHYMTEYGYIPLWVLVNVLTFGKITMFYSNMKAADKATVARSFHLQPNELHKYMSNLTQARNKCAHDERFYSMKFRLHIKVKSIPNFAALNIPVEDDGNYLYGTSDLFSVAVIFSRILPEAELRDFISSMEKEFEQLDKALTTIRAKDIMVKMGFGPDWKNLGEIWERNEAV